MSTEEFHGALSNYFKRYEFPSPPERVDGAVVLSVDGRYRVYCKPGPFGDLIFESHLADVPQSHREAEELMQTALLASMARMTSHADFPVLSPNGQVLLLQQRIPSDASLSEFEGSLENFVNSIADWRRIFRIL